MFLGGVLKDVHLVDEAFQRTVMLSIQAASQVNPATLRGWLFRIALNAAREIKREQKRQGNLRKAVWERSQIVESVTKVDGLFHAVSVEHQQVIRVALARLSENYREVVVRRIQKDQTFAVIADEMGRPLGTILTWMRRALAELREMEDVKQIFND